MMTQAQLATASLNDIVFDGRNKEYGAYELRAAYERHVRQALGWASLVLLLLLLYPVVSRLMADAFPVAPTEKHGGDIILDTFEFEKPLIQPPVVEKPMIQPPAAQPHASTIQFTPPVVAKDNLATGDPVPDQSTLVNTQVSTVTTIGTGDPALIPTDLPTETVAGGVVDTKIYTYVEQYPEVMAGGGVASIVAAIQKAVKYPAIDLRNGVEGKIFASFIVNSAGEITGVKIVKGLSETLDAETLRAIGTLPKLIPARQNGNPVNVSFTVPVTFKIQ